MYIYVTCGKSAELVLLAQVLRRDLLPSRVPNFFDSDCDCFSHTLPPKDSTNERSTEACVQFPAFLIIVLLLG